MQTKPYAFCTGKPPSRQSLILMLQSGLLHKGHNICYVTTARTACQGTRHR